MIQLMGVDDFLAMISNDAPKAALIEKQNARAYVYNLNVAQAVENGVDESVVHLYAQCALDEFDRRNIQ